MRRTTHFYVMVTSLLMLLLKDVRSDTADDNIDTCFAVKHIFYNINNSSHKQDLADYLNLDGNSFFTDKKLAPFMKDNAISIATPWHDKTSKINNHASDESDDVIQALNGQSLCHQGIDHSTSTSGHGAFQSRRHSKRRISRDANRQHSLVKEVRRIENRRDTLTRRHAYDREKDVRNRWEVRDRADVRRRSDVYERQSATRRLDLEARNHRESRTREDRDSRQKQDQNRRMDYRNQRYDIGRRNQRNSRSFERRGRYDENIPIRKMRNVERRNGQTYRNDLRSSDIIRNSYIRQEREEIRPENRNRRVYSKINYRSDRRANHESSDMLIRHSPELKQSNSLRSRNSNRRVITDQRGMSYQNEYREMNVITQRENNKFVNLETRLEQRRVDDLRFGTNRRISVRSRADTQSSFSRDKLDVTKLDDGRRLFDHKRDNREVRRHERITNKRENRREIRTYKEMRKTSDVRRMGNNKEALVGNDWSIDGLGVSRAILVGFVGILGRKIWQKQA